MFVCLHTRSLKVICRLFVSYRKTHHISLQIILTYWSIQKKLLTVMRLTHSWLETKSKAAYLKATTPLDMPYFNCWHSFMYITWSIPSHYVTLTSIYNSFVLGDHNVSSTPRILNNYHEAIQKYLVFANSL